MKRMAIWSALLLTFTGRAFPGEAEKASAKLGDGVMSAQILQYDETARRVLLNRALLDELAALSGPLHIVTAIGDTRIGKSTALNVMTAMLTCKDKKGRVHSVPPVFRVCQSLDTCTKGVWVHTIPLADNGGAGTGNGAGHLVILDVEGTDLGGDLLTTQFSLLTSYLSSDVIIFLKESVPKRTAIFLRELARLKERLKLHTNQADTNQKLYVTIRDPLKPPEDMSLKSYVSQTLTNPSYCADVPGECKLLEKHFPLTKVNVYSLPYVSRRLQKSLGWTLKDKGYMRTLALLTYDLKNAIEANKGATTHGHRFSGIIRTFMRTLQPSKVPPSPSGACEKGDSGCGEAGGSGVAVTESLQPLAGASGVASSADSIQPKVGTNGAAMTEGSASEAKASINPEKIPAIAATDQIETGEPFKVGSIEVEKIIKSPFETMGPGVLSFIMDNINRLRPSSRTPIMASEEAKKKEGDDNNDEDEEEDDDDNECKNSNGLGCQAKAAKKEAVPKWTKAVRTFIDDIAEALDDFFGSVMYE